MPPPVCQLPPGDLDHVELGAVGRQIEQESLVVGQPTFPCCLVDAVIDARVAQDNHGWTGAVGTQQAVNESHDFRAFDGARVSGANQRIRAENQCADYACASSDGSVRSHAANRAVTSFVEQAAIRRSRPHRDTAGVRCFPERPAAASRAWLASWPTPLRRASFERVAVALDRETVALGGLAQRIEVLKGQGTELLLKALGNLRPRQRFGRRHANCRRDHLGVQGTQSAALVTDSCQQTDDTLLAPDMRPVVDRLTADAELIGNHHRPEFAAGEHQQTCRTYANVLIRVIDRQLMQRRLLNFGQHNDALHSGLRLICSAEVNKIQTRLPDALIDWLVTTEISMAMRNYLSSENRL